MILINYVCSLGNACQTAKLFQIYGIKKCSFPFDWSFSDYQSIKYSIESNFEYLMDKNYHKQIVQNQKSTHTLIAKTFNDRYLNTFQSKNDVPIIFNHKDITTEQGYRYYERCVMRFQTLLTKENKLFMMINANRKEDDLSAYASELFELGKCLQSKSYSSYLLYIHHVKSNKYNATHHKVIKHENVILITLYVDDEIKGFSSVFANKQNDIYLWNIINTHYKLDIKDWG